MKKQFIHACIASLMLLVLSFWLLGFELETDGSRLLVVSRLDVPAWPWGRHLRLLVPDAARPDRAPIPGLHQRLLRRLHQAGAAKPGEAPNSITRTAVLVLLFAVSWPFMASRGAIDLATLTLIYIMLGLGLNVVVGLAALLDLGYVGFYAVGAYSYALLNSYFGLSFWGSPIAGLMAATFGFLLGFPVLRLRGDYLAIVTLGFGEIIRILLNNMTTLTGGPNGISGIPKPTLGAWSSTAPSRTAASRPSTSSSASPQREPQGDLPLPDGAGAGDRHPVRHQPIAAHAAGPRLGGAAGRRDRLQIPGAEPYHHQADRLHHRRCFAGFAGSFFASRQGFISPESFVFIESAIVPDCGAGRHGLPQIGVVLAAIVMTVLPELAREFNEYRMLMFGLLMVFMMIWRPQDCCPCRPIWSCVNEQQSHIVGCLRSVDALRRPARGQRRQAGREQGEVISIIGPNGAGKTTIFNCLTGFYRPSGGVIRYKGEGDPGPARPPHRPQGHSADLPARAPVQGDDGGGEPAGGPAQAPQHRLPRRPVQDPGLPPRRERGAGAVRVLAGEGGAQRSREPRREEPGLRPAAPARDRPLHGDPARAADAGRAAAGLNPHETDELNELIST